MRPNKIDYYMGIALAVAQRSPCSRRKFGAILVKNDSILASGYNGSVRGSRNCGEEVPCIKDIKKEESYKSYEFCPAIHAEVNSVLNAARNGVSVYGATLYLAVVGVEQKKGDRPCRNCRRVLINAGIKDAWFYTKELVLVHENVSDWIQLENNWMHENSMKPKDY